MTSIQTGSFTKASGDSGPMVVPIRGGVDYFRVVNVNQAQLVGSGSNTVAFQWEWYRGFTQNNSLVARRLPTSASTTAALIETTGGPYPINTASADVLGSSIAFTAISTAAVVTTSAAHGLSNGDIVRIISATGALQLNGVDFEISSASGSALTLRWLAGISASNKIAAAGTAGSLKLVRFAPIFYPRRRFIVEITQASQAVVRFSVAHGYSVGDVIRFHVPSEFGMQQINGRIGRVAAVSTTNNTVTVDISSSNFSAFALPATANATGNFAHVVPVGELGFTSSSATDNQAVEGMFLPGGAGNPGGSGGETVHWFSARSAIVT